ncbi:hypothetical protein BGZ94_001897 [Podila epigama]|nr:hypothetical protein BGZ94_001897 [Podila epigama]
MPSIFKKGDRTAEAHATLINPHGLPPLRERLREIFYSYFKFGYTTFGGPAVHAAILFDDIVMRRKWVSPEQFAELFAICQSLPGPGSTELAFSLALVRSGFLCSVLAFLFWSLPGAVIMTIVGIVIGGIDDEIPQWVVRLEQGLASAAIGLVALAAYRMSTNLATDKFTRLLALIAGSVTVLYSAAWLLPVIMIAGGLSGYIFDAFVGPLLERWQGRINARKNKKQKEEQDSKNEKGIDSDATHVREEAEHVTVELNGEGVEQGTDGGRAETESTKDASINGSIKSRSRNGAKSPVQDPLADLEEQAVETERKLFSYSKKLGFAFLLVFVGFFVAALLVRILSPVPPQADYAYLSASLYFVGSIIFGGGPVVIPMLKAYTVDAGWMSDQDFLLGLALIQSLPGPNFNFACFLGAVAMMNANGNGVLAAIVSFVSIFFPGLVLQSAIIPFWQLVREKKAVRMVFRGVNACALGLVFSAVWLLWLQVNRPGGHQGYHAVIASAAFVVCGYMNMPTPLAIALGGGMGVIEYAVSG